MNEEKQPQAPVLSATLVPMNDKRNSMRSQDKWGLVGGYSRTDLISLYNVVHVCPVCLYPGVTDAA